MKHNCWCSRDNNFKLNISFLLKHEWQISDPNVKFFIEGYRFEITSTLKNRYF